MNQNKNSVLGKQQEELELVKRLFEALDCSYVRLDPHDRPDVIATMTNDHKIGIEVTVFHGDEATCQKGSALRAEEEQTARRAPGQPYGMWSGLPKDYALAVGKRLQGKIQDAARFPTEGYDTLWLLIAASLPKLGATGSTFLLPQFLTPEDLNQFHQSLMSSRFEEVYLHCLMAENTVYRWTRAEQWKCVRAPQGFDGGKDLWFKSVLTDPEWLRDPDGKAREEAYKALSELNAAKEKLK